MPVSHNEVVIVASFSLLFKYPPRKLRLVETWCLLDAYTAVTTVARVSRLAERGAARLARASRLSPVWHC